MEACATSLLGNPEYAGLVGVALRATRWAPLSGVDECHSSFTTGGGAEDGLWIVTCIHSGLSWVKPLESLACLFCMVVVFCRVPHFIVCWGVSFPLGSVLELVVVESSVNHFVQFVFIFSFDLIRRRGFFDL